MGQSIEAMAADDPRLRRLRMRCWRRGFKEMDLILGGYADARSSALDGAALTAFEALIEEDDHPLYDWICGREAPPAHYALAVSRIQQHLESP